MFTKLLYWLIGLEVNHILFLLLYSDAVLTKCKLRESPSLAQYRTTEYHSVVFQTMQLHGRSDKSKQTTELSTFSYIWMVLRTVTTHFSTYFCYYCHCNRSIILCWEYRSTWSCDISCLWIWQKKRIIFYWMNWVPHNWTKNHLLETVKAFSRYNLVYRISWSIDILAGAPRRACNGKGLLSTQICT